MTRRAPGLGTLFTLAFGAAGLRVAIAPLSDNSFLWHLRTGHLILDSGIPRGDPYSFTVPGARWVAQSWLAEVLYAGADQLAGAFAIRLLMGAVGAAIAVLAFRLALRLAPGRVPAVLLTAAALWPSASMWAPRPLLLGVLAFVVLAWTVEVPDSLLGRRPMLVLPPLVWLWANVHGTFALGGAYLGLHLAGRWVEGAAPWRGRERALVLAGGAAGVACLANPYGLSLLLFPLHLVGQDTLRDVVEWRSPDLDTARGIAWAVWSSVLLGCLALGRQRPSRRDALIAVTFVLLGWWALRNVALAPLVTLPVAARALSGAPQQARLPDGAGGERSGRGRRPLLDWSLAAAIVALIGGWVVQAARQPDFALVSDGYPVRAMQFLEREDLLGRRMLTEDWSAGYVILRWWPRQQVFMDDRYDMYPAELVRDYVEVARGGREWDEVLDRWDVDVVVWSRGAVLDQLLTLAPSWRRVYRDQATVVYRREG